MENWVSIFNDGIQQGIIQFPFVLGIGILFQYLKILDISIDGIVIVGCITFVYCFNITGSLCFSFFSCISICMLFYLVVWFMTHYLNINNTLVGIILSLILHSFSTIWIGESIVIDDEVYNILAPQIYSSVLAILLIISVMWFFNTSLGVRIRAVSENYNLNSKIYFKKLLLLEYLLVGLIVGLGCIGYTLQKSSASSGGGFEILIPSLSSYLFINKSINYITSKIKDGKINYFNKIIKYLDSPVVKSLVGSILFQIMVFIIIYYTYNPNYWKLIFGLTLILTVSDFKDLKLNNYIKKHTDNSNFLVDSVSFSFVNGSIKKEVFNKLSIEIKRGITIIWGGNGIGKTTLLKLLSGDLKPSNGYIYMDGVDITLKNRGSRNTFYLTQNPFHCLAESLTVRENISTLIKQDTLKQVNPLQINDYLNKNFQFTQVINWSDLLDKPINELSGGQAQKVALMLALFSNNEIIVADEPSSGIDATNFDFMIDVFQELSSKNKYVIIVTHDIRFREIKANHVQLVGNTFQPLNI